MNWRPKLLRSVCLWLNAGLVCFSLFNPLLTHAITAPKPVEKSVRVYLNPNTGRFWTMDSYAGSNSDPLSLHKYLYCQDTPINGSDPSGHEFDAASISAVTGIMLFLGAHYAHASSSAIYAAEAQFGHGDFIDLAYGLSVAGILLDTVAIAEGGVAVAYGGAKIINWLRNLPENGAPIRGFVSGYSRLKEIANLEKAGSQSAAAELRAARFLREGGVNVHARAEAAQSGIEGRTSDFFIAGEKGTGRGGIPADVYSPGPNTSVRNALDYMSRKNNQARVIILDLNRPGVTATPDDFLNYCNGDIAQWLRTQKNATDIQEVLVLPK